MQTQYVWSMITLGVLIAKGRFCAESEEELQKQVDWLKAQFKYTHSTRIELHRDKELLLEFPVGHRT